MLKKSLCLLITMLLGLSICGGCSKKPEQKPVTPPTMIGVNVTTTDKDFKEQFKKAMEENAKQENISIVWKESTPEKQMDDVQKMLEQKVKALVVQFADEHMAEAIIRPAKEKDIPVLAVGTLPANVPLDGFIGIDAYRFGQQQALFMDKALQSQKPATIMIITSKGDSTAENLTRGNMEGLTTATGFEAIVQEVLSGESVGAVVAASPALEKIKGLIIHNPAWTQEVISLLQDLGLDQQIVTVGIGATKNNAVAIMQGSHEAEIDVDPVMLGKFTLTAAGELAKQGQWQFEKQVSSGVYEIPVKFIPANIITRDNLYLLEKRYKDLQKQGQTQQQQTSGNSQSGNSPAANNPTNQSSGGKQETQQNNSIVKIQTKEGKIMEIQVEGEVEKVEIQGGGQSKQGGAGGQSGSNQGSGQQQ